MNKFFGIVGLLCLLLALLGENFWVSPFRRLRRHWAFPSELRRTARRNLGSWFADQIDLAVTKDLPNERENMLQGYIRFLSTQHGAVHHEQLVQFVRESVSRDCMFLALSNGVVGSEKQVIAAARELLPFLIDKVQAYGVFPPSREQARKLIALALGGTRTLPFLTSPISDFEMVKIEELLRKERLKSPKPKTAPS